MSSKTEEDEDFNWEDDSEDEEDEEGDDDDDDTDADEKGCRPSNDDVQSNNSDVTDASLATVTRRCGQLGILDEAFEKVFFLYIRLSKLSYLDNIISFITQQVAYIILKLLTIRGKLRFGHQASPLVQYRCHKNILGFWILECFPLILGLFF